MPGPAAADRCAAVVAVTSSAGLRKPQKLRQKSITSAEDSLEFLRQALEIARDVVAADKLAESGVLKQFALPVTGGLFDRAYL